VGTFVGGSSLKEPLKELFKEHFEVLLLRYY
jgi:hypothetical protein